jgi:hypothetical protein
LSALTQQLSALPEMAETAGLPHKVLGLLLVPTCKIASNTGFCLFAGEYLRLRFFEASAQVEDIRIVRKSAEIFFWFGRFVIVRCILRMLYLVTSLVKQLASMMNK